MKQQAAIKISSDYDWSLTEPIIYASLILK